MKFDQDPVLMARLCAGVEQVVESVFVSFPDEEPEVITVALARALVLAAARRNVHESFTSRLTADLTAILRGSPKSPGAALH